MRSRFLLFYLGNIGADARGQTFWASLIVAGGALASVAVHPGWVQRFDALPGSPGSWVLMAALADST